MPIQTFALSSGKVPGERQQKLISETTPSGSSGGLFLAGRGSLCSPHTAGCVSPSPMVGPDAVKKAFIKGLVKASQNGRGLKAGTRTKEKGRP